jgi:hypothetical protein
VFSGSDARDDAVRAIADMRGLIDQQMYEFQGLKADLQLSAIVMQGLVEMRKVTDDVAEELRAAATNLKHELRDARQTVAEAVERLRELEQTLIHLEMDE